jgi:HAD superfamily phosphatase
MTLPLLVFDMDGVLVDVTESYRETIQQTVRHYTGTEISREAIQDYKNRGGYNDDWKLSHEVITKRGVAVTFEEVVNYFQGLFLGPHGNDGLILRETWVARPGILEKLNERFGFALFTGRQQFEAALTIGRFAPHLTFAPIVGMHDVPNLKPAPDGLLKIRALDPGRPLWYVGDTVDDARAACAAAVPFVGVAAPDAPRHEDLVKLFRELGARAVIDDINSLPEALQA